MDALDFLSGLVGRTLSHAIKSSDMDLYDFGFVGEWSGDTYILHALCRFKVIWKNGACRSAEYCEDTPAEQFHGQIKCLFGLEIKRAALSEKNDLWVDFGDYWVVFATHENGEESWRVFVWHSDDLHLVASDVWLKFQ